MIPYASNTASSRNLTALRAYNWRILLTPLNPRLPERFRYAVDNGAWSCFQQGKSFDADAFNRLIDPHGAGADFVVVPDIVAGGLKSLDFSVSWMDTLRHFRLPLLPVQDGMTADQVGAVLRLYPTLGIFLGGSTEWKVATMYAWGAVAASMGRHYHVGRVNTKRRIQLCEEAGADSFDGTSATKFSCTLPLLESARRQPRLFTARN